MTRRLARRQPGGLWSVVGTTATSKVLVMGLSGLLAVVTSRLIIQNFGTEAYAQYGLLSTMPALLPFADLGIAAAVINAVATSQAPAQDDVVRRTMTSAFRILLVSGALIVALSAVLSLGGWWDAILGAGLLPDGGSTAAFLCLAIFGLALPLGIGQRVLVGLGKTHVQIATQAIVAPFMLASISVLVLLGVRGGSYLAVFSYIAGGIVSLLCLVLAARAIRPQFRRAIRDIPHVRSAPGVAVMGVAWPMLVQMIALPVAMQTDRLLLSHLTRGDELAQYNLGSQLFGMITQTIAAAGLALWPVFARARSSSTVQSPYAAMLGFLGGGLGLAGALAVLLPWVTGIISDGRITLDAWLVGGFIVFVGAQAAKYPLGMYMTDQRGLRFQVVPIVAMVPLNLGLSWWLIGQVGAGGPIVGSAVSVIVCQVVPNLWFVRGDLARRRAQTSAEAIATPATDTTAPDAPAGESRG